MPALAGMWDPNEWELFACGLLQDRHGAINLMSVPARHKGDHGIDYYCLRDGVAYQCYAVQEPCEVVDRAEKQKAKITSDLGKLRTNAAEIQRLFGNAKISRWILVVPVHDSSDVNKHLTKKTSEVKGWTIPFVDAGFEALIQDLKSFDSASVAARNLGRSTIILAEQPPTGQQIVQWTAASDPLVARLTEKMRKRASSANEVELNSLVNDAVEWFLERENALDVLRNDAPQLFEMLFGVITRHTERLRLYGPPASGAAGAILRTELETLIAEFIACVPNFSDSSAQQLALGTVADWLMRCPLDFPPYSHV